MVALVMLIMATVAFAGQQKVWALQYYWDETRGGYFWSDMRRGDGNNFTVGNYVGAQVIGMPGTHVWEIYRDGAVVASGTVVVPGNYFNINFGYELTEENDAGYHFQVVVNGLKDRFQVKPMRLLKTLSNENKKIDVVQFQHDTDVLVSQQANKLFVGNDVGVRIFGLVGDCQWHLLRTEKSATTLAAEGTINVLSDGYVNLSYQMIDSDAGCKFLLRVWEDHLPYEPFMARFQVQTSPRSLSAYPNPFNPVTTINYTSESAGNVEVKIIDMLGREVIILHRGQLNAGNHTFRWNANNVPSGQYICCIVSGGSTVHTLRLTLLK